MAPNSSAKSSLIIELGVPVSTKKDVFTLFIFPKPSNFTNESPSQLLPTLFKLLFKLLLIG